MKFKSIVLLIILSFVLAACIKIPQATKTNKETPKDESSSKTVKDDTASDQSASMTASVSVTDGGFEPKSVTIKKGGTVTWTSNSDIDAWVASAFHPTHLEYPGFDQLKGMKRGETYSFTFEKVGTWKYHDHLMPSRNGVVVVIE